MALIQITLTEAEKLARTRAEIDVHLGQGAKDLYYRATQIWALFWANPQGLTCQQVFDSFGPQALDMAMMLNSSKLLIDKVDPTIWELTRPGTVTPVLVNGVPNGSVTVTLNP